ncbi:MAG: deoxyribonuclease IV [bacterium]|nr:deoxyribonuclease IV [bacterium]
MRLGSHVGMSGKEMMLGSAKEAHSYGANTFMLYTGAPQNTRRKDISELNIDAAWDYMKQHDIDDIVVHAPYIINLGNTVKPETFEIAIQFLDLELKRTEAMRAKYLVLHPGAHVGAGEEAGIKQIVTGLNEVLTREQNVYVCLETMAGKGTELGCTFEQLAKIYDGVKFNDKLRVCFDTCHVNDQGYDLVNDLDGVFDQFDRVLGKDQIAVFHINDSKNVLGAKKDRHENIGFGNLGFDTVKNIIYHKDFMNVPKILETPYVAVPGETKKTLAPYKYEIAMLKEGVFHENLIEEILAQK